MKDITTLLREADPVAREPGLPADDVAGMRRRVLAAAHTPAPYSARWRVAAIAAAAALVAGAGVATMRRPSPPQAAAPAAAGSATAVDSRTQLHFSTPGGTRIIWTLDPAFQLTEKR